MPRALVCLAALILLLSAPLAFADKITPLGPLPFPPPTSDPGSNPQRLIATSNGLVYFLANDGSGIKLWRTDGTEAGTFSPATFPGTITSTTPMFAGPDGYLYYSYSCGGLGYSMQLYALDGTQNGTTEVDATYSSSPILPYLAMCNGSLYWYANDIYVGTNHYLKKISAGKVISQVNEGTDSNLGLFSANDKLYLNMSGGLYEYTGARFIAHTNPDYLSALGNKLAIRESTFKLLDPANGAMTNYSFIPQDFLSFDKKLYFTAANVGKKNLYLAESDDTASTVSLISKYHFFPDKPMLAATTDTLCAACDDGVHGMELYKIDRQKKLSLLKDITPGVVSTQFIAMAPYAHGVAFLTLDSSNNTCLWKTDGTPEGTQLIKTTGTSPDGTGELVAQGDKIFFTGTDNHGKEPWISDGTTDGTHIIKNLQPAIITQNFYQGFANTATESFFLGCENNNIYLLKSDGTTAGTQNLGLLGPLGTGYAAPPYFSIKTASVPGGLFLLAGIYLGYTPSGQFNYTDYLIFYDTTIKQTQSLGQWWHGQIDTDMITPLVYPFMNTIGNLLFFSDASTDNSSTSYNYNLWQSNGTLKGTQVSSANPKGDSQTVILGTMGSSIYFAADDGTHGRQLWRSNGTSAGTYMIRNTAAGLTVPTTYTYGIDHTGTSYGIVLGNYLYFQGYTPAGGTELCKTIGAESGIVQLKDIYPGATGSSPTDFSLAGGQIVFAATDPTDGRELFVSNGTPSGTKLLKDMNPGAASSNPAFLCQNNGIAFYTCTPAAYQTQLWRTDGTGAGTYLVSGSVNPYSFKMWANIGNKTFFYASQYGLYVTDGTVAGTYLLTTHATSGFSRCAWVVISNQLYFRYGTELWRTDGTVANTLQLVGVPACDCLMGAAGNKLLFYASNQLWAYDTTGDAAAKVWKGYR